MRGFNPWEDSLEEGWQPTPEFLPGESHGQRNLVGYSPWGCKELAMTKRAHTHSYYALRKLQVQMC